MAKKEEEEDVEELEEEVEEEAPVEEPEPEVLEKHQLEFKEVMTGRGMMKRYPDGSMEPL
jgi:hypothetical protein